MSKILLTQQERILISYAVTTIPNVNRHQYWKSDLPDSIFRMHCYACLQLQEKDWKVMNRQDISIKLKPAEACAIFYALDVLFVMLNTEDAIAHSRSALNKLNTLI